MLRNTAIVQQLLHNHREKVLDYYECRNFIPVIEKVKKACKNSSYATVDHFADITEMIEIRKGGQRQIADVRLSRYARG